MTKSSVFLYLNPILSLCSILGPSETQVSNESPQASTMNGDADVRDKDSDISDLEPSGAQENNNDLSGISKLVTSLDENAAGPSQQKDKSRTGDSYINTSSEFIIVDENMKG